MPPPWRRPPPRGTVPTTSKQRPNARIPRSDGRRREASRRIVGSEGDYYIVTRSFGLRRYRLPKRQAKVDLEEVRVLMRLPRRELFAAPKVQRDGHLDPATDGHYSR